MTTVNEKRDFKDTRKDTVKAAKDLGYSEFVIDALKHSKNINELQRIMITERKKHFED